MWDQFFQKSFFCSKTEKMNIVTEFYMLELPGFSSDGQRSGYGYPIFHWAAILWDLDTFVVFPNFLRS